MGSPKKTFLKRLDDVLDRAAAYGVRVAEHVPGTRDKINELVERRSDNIDMIEMGMELGVLLAKLEMRILHKKPEDL